MKVDVLFFDGCPHHESLLPHLRALLNAGGAGDAAIELVRIEDADAAKAERFLGSPTIRIDGEDVEPGADERTDFGLKCRLFATPDGMRGMPADEWVLRALERARIRDTFPACDDAPLALTLVRLLAGGTPVTDAMLAAAVERAPDDVAAQLARWPNIERAADGAVIGFSGLTLRPTAHGFQVDGRQLHTWCAWDTLFLPSMLDSTALVRSACPVSGRAVDLVVAPDGIEHADPPRIYVSFPALTNMNTADITGTFCCHVHFLAGADAARTWQRNHRDGHVLDLTAAFDLGCRATAPLTRGVPAR
jgi:alkylmercury lyase